MRIVPATAASITSMPWMASTPSTPQPKVASKASAMPR